MEFKVRLFLGDQLLDPSDYSKVYIHCKDIDRIVNDIYERNLRWRLENGLPPPMAEDDDEPPAKKPSVLKALAFVPIPFFRCSYISQFVREKRQIYCF